MHPLAQNKLAAFHVMVSVAFLTGTLSILSVATALFAAMSGGGVIIYPALEPSVGGPALSQGPLHGAAPVMVAQSNAIEHITLGVLLIALGYALHAVIERRERRVAVHAKRRRSKSARR